MSGYRDLFYIIHTDGETDDAIFWAMFMGWVLENKQYFEQNNHYPLHGLVAGETDNPKVKTQRLRDFAVMFGNVTGWSNPANLLYEQYLESLDQIYFDAESDKRFSTETELITQDSTELLEPKRFLDHFDKIHSLPASRYYAFYLKPNRFLTEMYSRLSKETANRIFDYLLQVPAAMYGSFNIRTMLEDAKDEEKDMLMRFINRTTDEAPIIYCETYHALGRENSIIPKYSPKLFKGLEQKINCPVRTLIRSTMVCWNQHILNAQLAKVAKDPAFTGADMSDVNGLERILETIPDNQEKRRSGLYRKLKVIRNVVESDLKQCVFADPLCMLGFRMLCDNKIYLDKPLILTKSTLALNGEYIAATDDPGSNTLVMFKNLSKDSELSQIETCCQILDQYMGELFALL